MDKRVKLFVQLVDGKVYEAVNVIVDDKDKQHFSVVLNADKKHVDSILVKRFFTSK